MTNRFSIAAFALMLSFFVPSVALAQRGGDRPAPAPRPAAPAPRAAAPVARQAPPAPRPAVPAGFNLRRDTAPPPAAVRSAPAAPRYAPGAPHGAAPVAGRPNGAPAYARPSFTANSTGGPFHARFTGPVIRNARGDGGHYGWNHGVVWQPAPIYWGGGFWGSFAIASLAGLAAYGDYVDTQDQLDYPSYQVDPDTPGADLLADYNLYQTPCGPPNLVVIWGPDNSVICAVPNAQVGPGNYEVDPETFTLISASP